jgi:hypothetical protein
MAYSSRYARVLVGAEIEFVVPADESRLDVAERHVGNATTDYGAPAQMLDADRLTLDDGEFENQKSILRASWSAFDDAVERAEGRELRKGPRGGGRDLEGILSHMLDADQAYLGRLAWAHKGEGEEDLLQEIVLTRRVILDALEVAVREGLPERGPRGGILWTPRFFLRRLTWHVLDHAWEIEDRLG